MAVPSNKALLLFIWKYRTDTEYRKKVNQSSGDQLWTREQYFNRIGQVLPKYLPRISEIDYAASQIDNETSRNIINLIDLIYADKEALDRLSLPTRTLPLSETKLSQTTLITPQPPLPITPHPTARPLQQKPPQRIPETEITRIPKAPGEQPFPHTTPITPSAATSSPQTIPQPEKPTPTPSGRVSQTRPIVFPQVPLGSSPRNSAPIITPPLQTLPIPSYSPHTRSGNPPTQSPSFLNNLLNPLINLGRNPSNRASSNSPREQNNNVRRVGKWVLIILLILLFLYLLSILFGLFDLQNSQISIRKTGDSTVDNGAEINYQIQVTYSGTGTASARITDTLPKEIDFISASDDGTEQPPNSKIVIWNIPSLSPSLNKILTLKVKVKDEFKDFWAVNRVRADIIGTSGTQTATSSGGLLPIPIPPQADSWEEQRSSILAAVNKYPENIEAYKIASFASGVSWEALAGLHFVETGSNPAPSKSLVSGRNIGSVEPDVPIALCGKVSVQRGDPIPIGEGCGFATLLDSAIYAGKHLSGKINRPPQNFEDFVTAMSLYNGGDNANCDEDVPYSNDTNCPNKRVKEISGGGPIILRAPLFKGEDDPYAMAFFDQKHQGMYSIFCADGTRCSPLRPFQRPGAMAVVRALIEK